MGDGKTAFSQFGEQRLHVAQNGFTGCGIAHMAQGGMALEAVDGGGGREVVAHQSHAALGMEAAFIVGHNARSFLSAMLQSVQSQGCKGRGVGVAINAKHAAFFTQRVAIKIEVGPVCHWELPLASGAGC